MTQMTLREYLRTTEDAISSGRTDEAMANCQNILTYFPEALEAQRLLGEVYLAQGHLTEAQQTFEWVLTNDPENVIVYCDRALISERTSDIDTALDCYQQAYELSRGNANIRQEFNQLSARVGQQEFMFSRAGLARLYMRGDLLTQAMQEWDAVLAISPERLDARLGQMETYWREGLYTRAETIAQQLLEEIPTCLKALLFLAHMTSISHLQRARELLQRAEALDPDLTMARELFADLAARQPNDPFLELLKKEPILLENGKPLHLPSATASPPAAGTSTAAPLESREVRESREEQSPDSAFVTPPAADVRSYDAPSSISDPLSWQELMEPSITTQAAQPWYQHEHFTTSNGATTRSWNPPEEASPPEATWSNDAQEEELPAHPAWLDTLTRSDQQPAAIPLPAASPQPEEQPEASASSAPPPPPAQSSMAEPAEEALPFFFPVEDEADTDMGWPQWLKSLGAEALEPEQRPSEPLPEIDDTPIRPQAETPAWEEPPRSAEVSLPPESDPWAALPSMSASNDTWTPPARQPEWLQQITPTQNSTPDWMQPFAARDHPVEPGSQPDWMHQLAADDSPAQAPVPDWMHQLTTGEQHTTSREISASEQEQRSLASLADLEKDLQSQGFVPLAPGSLAALAQHQMAAPPIAPDALPPALAQLSTFSQPQQPLPGDDPWWQSMTPQVDEQPTEPHPAIQQNTNPFAALGAKISDASSQPPPLSPVSPGFTRDTSAELTPAYRSDALLDSDLETTMKRPAITLEPLQTGNAQSGRPPATGKGSLERRHLDHADESALSNLERLVRGYQYQLSGSYDEAMQDYRVIIRNAPELLEDVISNMRALLKIHPRFSLGYRVLGDAYMRKGEYLQAMEAYNKALTMAKKARN
jgi:tetratricopeptide (TPR) repeat protein